MGLNVKFKINRYISVWRITNNSGTDILPITTLVKKMKIRFRNLNSDTFQFLGKFVFNISLKGLSLFL